MLKCKYCNKRFDEDDPDELNLQVCRDGDPYDPLTRFWYLCPFCGNELDEISDT